MKERNHIDRNLILNFFRKKMNREETKVFREKMREDSFQEKVSEEAVRQFGREQLKTKLDSIHLTIETEQKRRRIYIALFLVVLAVLIAIVCWQFMLSPANLPVMKPAEIYASYFDPYPSIFDQKGELSSDEQTFSSAMNAYTTKNYPEAIRLFEIQLNSNEEKKSLHSFYYAIALLANQESDKAIIELEQLKASAHSLLPEAPLRWYLALAYLAQDRKSAARPLLEWVAGQQENKFKQKEAEEILQRL